MSKEQDECVFPIIHPDGGGVQYWGLGLRDYFAAKAMAAMISHYGYVRGETDYVSDSAYDCADAMLEARKK